MTRIDLGQVKGRDGVSISSITKIETGDIDTQIDTYRITFSNGETFDYTITNNEYINIIDEIIESDEYVPTSKAVSDKVNEIVDDIYTKAEANNKFALKSHNHGNLTSTGTVTTTSNDNFTYFVGLGSSNNKVFKASKLNSNQVIDATAHQNIGSSANATQSSINTAIDTKIGAKFNNPIIVTATQENPSDLDEYLDNGLFFFFNNASTEFVSNKPPITNSHSFYLSVYRRNDNNVRQVASDYTNSKTFVRSKYDGTWGNWKEVVTTDNIKTVNNISLIGSGNITVSGSGEGGSVDIATSWGSTTSDSKVPSEKLVKTSLDNKVDSVSGKGLSSNDYTTTEKNKLASLNNYTHPTYTSKASGLYKITVDGTGHISGASAVAKSDITSLGIPSQDTVYTHPSYTALTGVPTANATPSFGGTFKVSQPVTDATGHTTAINQRTITIPSTNASSSTKGLVYLESTPTDNSTKAITSGAVYSAINNHSHTLSDVTDYITYEIIPSTYNPKIGSKISITFKATNGDGSGVVASDTLTIKSTEYENVDKYNSNSFALYNSQIGTNSNGTYTLNDFPILAWGIIDIEWNGVHCQLFSDGWLQKGNDFETPSWLICRNANRGKLVLSGWETTTSLASTNYDSSWVQFGGNSGTTYINKLRPKSPVIGLDSYAKAYFRIQPTSTGGVIKVRAVNSSIAQINLNDHFSGEIEWGIRNDDLDNYIIYITQDGSYFEFAQS